MKRVLSFICLMFLCVSSVNAKTITFEEVANKFKEPLKVDLNGAEVMVKAIEDNTTVTINDNSIISNYKKDDIDRTVTFNHSNGIITYVYEGSKNDENTVSNSMIDAMLLAKLMIVINDLHGNSIEDLAVFDDNATTFTLDKHGLEVKMFEYENKTESSSISIKGYDTAKIDINKFNLKGISNTPNKNEINNNNETNEVKNPQTGVYDTALIALLILTSGLIIIKISKKDVIKKI